MDKIVVACDSFKGCMSSKDIAQAVADVVHAIDASAHVEQVAVADGGEGTVEALVAACNHPVRWASCSVDATLRELPQVEACYALDSDGKTAYMELAAASGLMLVPHDKRDIMRASTLGTGQLILDAVEHGCRNIIMGLGGSATCDGGMGLLCALGVEFFDDKGHYLEPCAESLGLIYEIDCTGLNPMLDEVKITLLTDVENPLCGLQGAAHVFAPQKGATPEQVEIIEQGMCHYAKFLDNIAIRPGAGAAGGVAAGMTALLSHCELLKGAPFILGQARLESRITNASLVITGEGRIDSQTTMGKVPQAVAAIAKRHSVPVVAICGTVASDVDAHALGFERIIPVTPPDMPIDIAIQPLVARDNIAHAITQLFAK